MICICTKHYTGCHQHPLPVAQERDHRILLLS
nr:MAG TPA: hypothetical protein [Caudoviricetes sp.]